MQNQSAPQSNQAQIIYHRPSGINAGADIKQSLPNFMKLLLAGALLIFTQFAATDLSRSLCGYDSYNGRPYSSRYLGRQSCKLKAVQVQAVINVPLFLVSLWLWDRYRDKKSYNDIVSTYFYVASFNVIILMFNLVGYLYEVNERLTIYLVSGTLILTFSIGLVLVQEKLFNNNHKNDNKVLESDKD